MLKVVVVDDEPPARRAMEQLIGRYPDLTLVGQAATVTEAVTLIQQQRPDVAFLDIEMGATSGFSVVRQMASPPHIVVVTAHSVHAPAAFDVAAVDFLLKPVIPRRFAATVRRLRRLQAAEQALRGGDRAASPIQLRIATRRGTRMLDLSRLLAAQAERDFCLLTIVDEQPALVSRSLGSLSADLPSPPFLRLSRSLIINLSRVIRTQTISRDETRVFMEGLAAPLALGRQAAATLKLNLDRSPSLLRG